MKKYQALLMTIILCDMQDVLTSSLDAELNEKDVIFDASEFFE